MLDFSSVSRFFTWFSRRPSICCFSSLLPFSATQLLLRSTFTHCTPQYDVSCAHKLSPSSIDWCVLFLQVPAGVKVTRLTSASSCGVGDDAKALEDNLERVRSETNVRCFSILSDMFDFLVGPKGLASLQP
jgi:hypothetical protein